MRHTPTCHSSCGRTTANRRHGGQTRETYGAPADEVLTGRRHGVRKVNVHTDIRLGITGAMLRHMAEKPGEFEPPELNQIAR